VGGGPVSVQLDQRRPVRLFRGKAHLSREQRKGLLLPVWEADLGAAAGIIAAYSGTALVAAGQSGRDGACEIPAVCGVCGPYH
jgi:hypothetical protein